MLARSALAFAAMSTVLDSSQAATPPAEAQKSTQYSYPAEKAPCPVDVILHPVFHIIEEPGGIQHLADCEVPTEEYYTALAADMRARHPDVSAGLLEHLEAVEPFLDISIAAGFSYGISKAFVAVQEGTLLGHRVSRSGSHHEPEMTDAITQFAPLFDQTQVRQFVGSTNWVRRYLSSCYPSAVKILGEYMKPGAVFPPAGLGVGDTLGDKAVKAIKLMCKHAIEISVIDETSAIDGSRPLEQVADACGIAWGSTNVQMTLDLNGFKVRLMVGKRGLLLSWMASPSWPVSELKGSSSAPCAR